MYVAIYGEHPLKRRTKSRAIHVLSLAICATLSSGCQPERPEVQEEVFVEGPYGIRVSLHGRNLLQPKVRLYFHAQAFAITPRDPSVISWTDDLIEFRPFPPLSGRFDIQWEGGSLLAGMFTPESLVHHWRDWPQDRAREGSNGPVRQPSGPSLDRSSPSERAGPLPTAMVHLWTPR